MEVEEKKHDVKPDNSMIMSKDRLQQILVNPIIVRRRELVSTDLSAVNFYNM